MQNTFEFVGKIFLQNDNYKVYDKSNGITKRYSFAVKASNNNSEFVNLLSWEGKNMKHFYASLYDEDAKKVEWTKIPLSDKNDNDIIKKAMASSKYQTNIMGERKQFIYVPDYLEYIKNNLYKALSKNPDQMFKVQGDIEVNAYNGNYSLNYNVRNIWLADDEDEGYLKLLLDLYYMQGSVDESKAVTDGVYKVNGYLNQYDRQSKKYLYFPIQLLYKTPPEDDKLEQKRKELTLQVLTKNIRKNEVYHMGWEVKLFNGAKVIEKIELTEQQQLEVDLGLRKPEEFAKKSTGPNVKELVMDKYILKYEFDNGRVKASVDESELLGKTHSFDDTVTETNTVDLEKEQEELLNELDVDDDDLPF